MIGTHIGTHWVLISANWCPQWRHDLMRFRLSGASAVPDVAHAESKDQRAGPAKSGDPRGSQIWWTKNHSHHILMGFMSWNVMNIDESGFSIGTKPHIVLILSVAWQIWACQTGLFKQICVCKELPWRWSLILKFQLFFCVVALLQKTRSEGKTSSTLALYLFCLGF